MGAEEGTAEHGLDLFEGDSGRILRECDHVCDSEATSEVDQHARTDVDGLRVGRDGVVELPIHVSGRHVDDHPSECHWLPCSRADWDYGPSIAKAADILTIPAAT
jgi:hypothetical protein